MQRWFWIFLMLLPVATVSAKDKKLGGYVLDAAAFRKIQSYCIDTHNLSSLEMRVIDQFVSRESKPGGLLDRLPWHRLPAYQGGDPDAIVRLEFPHNHSYIRSLDVNGMLFLFRPGSPSPFYEAREVLMGGGADGDNSASTVEFLEHDAPASAVWILIRDWQKLSGPLLPAVS